MEKHLGVLKQVGSLSGGEIVSPVDQDGNKKLIGSFRVATQVDAIQIGETILKKPRVEGALFEKLQPGREACLYVHRYLMRSPAVIGVKYKDDGSKLIISQSYFRGSLIQYATVFALMCGIAGFVGVMIVGGILHLPGGEFLPVLGLIAGVGFSWYCGWQLYKDYGEAKAD